VFSRCVHFCISLNELLSFSFKVKLNLVSFMEALCCENMLTLLERYPMRQPHEKLYREIILSKIQQKPLHILGSSDFPDLKVENLEAVMESILDGDGIKSTADNEEMLGALWDWGKAEFFRRGGEDDGRSKLVTRVMEVMPGKVKQATDVATMRLHFTKLEKLETAGKRKRKTCLNNEKARLYSSCSPYYI